LPKQYYNNGKDAKPLNEDENGWDTRSLKHINNQYLGGNDAQTEKSMGFMDSNSGGAKILDQIPVRAFRELLSCNY